VRRGREGGREEGCCDNRERFIGTQGKAKEEESNNNKNNNKEEEGEDKPTSQRTKR